MMVIIIMIIFLHGKTSCFFGALKLWKVHTPFLKEVGYVNDSEFPFFLSKNFMHSLFLLMSEKEKKSSLLWKMFTFDGTQEHINS